MWWSELIDLLQLLLGLFNVVEYSITSDEHSMTPTCKDTNTATMRVWWSEWIGLIFGLIEYPMTFIDAVMIYIATSQCDKIVVLSEIY